MGINIQGTNVSSPVRPFNTDDTFPTAWMDEIKGGFHSVGSMSTIDLELPSDRRQVGMWINVLDESKIYSLNSDYEWTEVSFSSNIQSLQVSNISDFDSIFYSGVFILEGLNGIYIGNSVDANTFEQMVIFNNIVYSRTIDTNDNPTLFPSFSERYLKASDVDNSIIEGSLNPVTGGAVFSALDTKEDKNLVANNYYVTNIDEFSDALYEASISNLPTSIFVGGTITLTQNLAFPGQKQIKIIGQPLADINLAGYKLTGSALNFENIIFLNPSQYGYLFTTNGNARIKNCYFHSDNADANGAIPHITISGFTGTSTGLISLDGIRHQTGSYYVNSNPSILIQPINIVVNYSGYVNLFIEINNVSAVSGFKRFSRVLIKANYASTIRVSGDESWFYAPEQKMPGEGYISSDSVILKESSADTLYVPRLQQYPNHISSISTDSNNKIISSPKSIIRVQNISSLILPSFWESISITPFIEMIVNVYDDGENNGLYSLKNILYTNSSSWSKIEAAGDSFPTNYITSIEEIDAQVAPAKSGVLLSEDYLDWGTRFFTLLTLPYGGGDVNVSQMAISFSPDSESTPTLHSRWGACSELVNNGEPAWTPWKSISGTGNAGDMLKEIYDSNNDGIVDRAKADENGLNIAAYYNRKIQATYLVKYWRATSPTSEDAGTPGDEWYNYSTRTMYAYTTDEVWVNANISQSGVHRFENKFYVWNGSGMILIADADAPITSLKDGVDETGNTLKKLYDLIVSSGAQVNVIESLKIDGKLVPITSKELSISVDDSVTVNLTGGVMTVGLSDKYKNLIAAAL